MAPRLEHANLCVTNIESDGHVSANRISGVSGSG